MSQSNQLPLLKLGAIIALPVLILLSIIFFKNHSAQTPSSKKADIAGNLPAAKLDESEIQNLANKAGSANYVLLGESSHGTSEYYSWRSKISQNLIQDHEFSFIVVEGDWASLYQINRYVKHLSNEFETGQEILKTFERWPTWMWANKEFLDLVEWLRNYNQDLPLEQRVGVYGKDVYGIEESAPLVLSYLDKNDSQIAQQAQQAYDCLLDYQEDFSAYINDFLTQNKSCQDEIVAVTDYLKNNAEHYQQITSDKEYLNAKQNALVVQNGEVYYRLSAVQGPANWNSRVNHMKQTVSRLNEYYQQLQGSSKGIVWAHNTHVGDARATEMAQSNMVNIGQLLREEHSQDQVFIIGFGTHEGTVAAGYEWGSPMQVVDIPPAIEGSVEQLLNTHEHDSFILFLDEPLPSSLEEPRGHRAKGVVYVPDNDRHQYVTTLLPERYNAFIFINKTQALTPINTN